MLQHVSWTGYDSVEFYNRQFGAYGAHGWIKELQNHRSLAPSNARSMARLPKLELSSLIGIQYIVRCSSRP